MLRKLLHKTFEASILFKGIDGILEMAGGVLLLFVDPAMISRLVLSLTQHELSEDPKDIMANYLLQAAHDLSLGTRLFGSVYLLSHGVIKVVLVISLWKGKLWSYPAAILFLVGFIFYQAYRYCYSREIWLLFLSVFDVFIVVLIWLEYRHAKRRLTY